MRKIFFIKQRFQKYGYNYSKLQFVTTKYSIFDLEGNKNRNKMMFNVDKDKSYSDLSFTYLELLNAKCLISKY